MQLQLQWLAHPSTLPPTPLWINWYGKCPSNVETGTWDDALHVSNGDQFGELLNHWRDRIVDAGWSMRSAAKWAVNSDCSIHRFFDSVSLDISVSTAKGEEREEKRGVLNKLHKRDPRWRLKGHPLIVRKLLLPPHPESRKDQHPNHAFACGFLMDFLYYHKTFHPNTQLVCEKSSFQLRQ